MYADLPSLYIEISILTQPHVVSSYADIKIGLDGIVLSKNGKSAVFLPKVAIEQNWDLQTTLQHLAHKAGLPAYVWQDDTTSLQIFQSIDFAEPSQ